MKNWLGSVFGWLAGRKTYLAAFLLVVVVVWLAALGRLTPDTALAVLLVFVAIFASTFRDAIGRHQAEELQILTEATAVAREVMAHNVKAAVADGLATAVAAQQLAAEIRSDKGAGQP